MNKVFGISYVPSGSRQGDRSAVSPPIAISLGKMPLAQIKKHMEGCLHDLPGFEAERLRYKITTTLSVADLWLLRSDMYQSIAKQHNQTEAALRINGLLSHFAHWLPARQLSKI